MADSDRNDDLNDPFSEGYWTDEDSKAMKEEDKKTNSGKSRAFYQEIGRKGGKSSSKNKGRSKNKR